MIDMRNRCFISAVVIIGLIIFNSSRAIAVVTTIDNLLYKLNEENSTIYDVDYRVSLSLSDEDIEYKIVLHSSKSDNDTLSECNYRIEYITPRSEKGFACYSDGNYFQYDNNKLREYHWKWDSIPFKPQLNGGIQGRGLFVSLLPSKIYVDINKMRNDSNNIVRFTPDTIIKQNRVSVVEIFERKRGVVMRELLYSFNRETGAIENIEIENNPGTLGEQSVRASFKLRSRDRIDSAFYGEAKLMKDYPEEFEKYRVSNFAIENLPGRRLPDFSLPTTTSERYTWDGGFKAPTIIVFLDSKGGMSAETIKEVRSAVAQMPITADIIWIFTGNHLEDIWNLMPHTQLGETALIGGKRFSSECGVTGCPTLLFVGKDGIVRDVVLGFNKDIKNVVIQKTTIL